MNFGPASINLHHVPWLPHPCQYFSILHTNIMYMYLYIFIYVCVVIRRSSPSMHFFQGPGFHFASQLFGRFLHPSMSCEKDMEKGMKQKTCYNHMTWDSSAPNTRSTSQGCCGPWARRCKQRQKVQKSKACMRKMCEYLCIYVFQ